jgi:hypothetical protein
VGVERFCEAAVIAALTVSGLVVSHAKQPATNVVLSAPGGEVPMQAEESVLYNILGFVFGEPKADQIS